MEADLSHGWARKLGWVAFEPQGSMTFRFSSIQDPLQILTLHTLKSYGEKWEGSALEVTISQRLPQSTGNATRGNANEFTTVKKQTIPGVHNSTSSITYSTEIKFPPIPAGSDVTLTLQLVGGTTFKVTGMMLCSR
jgi:hypothetical protein